MVIIVILQKLVFVTKDNKFKFGIEPFYLLDKKTETKKRSKSEGADLLVKTNEQAQIPEGKELFIKRSDIAKMSDAEFMQYEKEIVKAQREGRLID